MWFKIWNQPTQQVLERIPKLYATEETALKDKLIYEHFFIFSSDWYIAEYDPKEEIMFGFAILNNDFQNAEWKYISYSELSDLNVSGFEIETGKSDLIKNFGKLNRSNADYKYVLTTSR